jgi:hypothetical protein
MITQRKVMALTMFIWVLITVIYACIYVNTILKLPSLEGYEIEWQFQLLMFSIYRLPWLIIGLAVIAVIVGRVRR